MQVMQHELDKKKITYIVTAAVQGGGLGYEDQSRHQSQIDRLEGRDFKKCQSATLIKMCISAKAYSVLDFHLLRHITT